MLFITLCRPALPTAIFSRNATKWASKQGVFTLNISKMYHDDEQLALTFNESFKIAGGDLVDFLDAVLPLFGGPLRFLV